MMWQLCLSSDCGCSALPSLSFSQVSTFRIVQSRIKGHLSGTVPWAPKQGCLKRTSSQLDVALGGVHSIYCALRSHDIDLRGALHGVCTTGNVRTEQYK